MSKDRSIDISALDRITKAIKSLSDVDLKKLGDSNFEIQIKFTRKRDNELAPISPLPMEAIAAKLTTFDDRKEAQVYLRSIAETKKDLERVARHFEMVISKQDTVDVLAERIIETTVGARLRSRAIQGTASPESHTDSTFEKKSASS
ncbi:hypothetical protein [Burkholderia plantarii]|uniref:hypothetical protein n=1 Tax=Burkholderia plantarii TaxID=41899 RepID=UPI0018DB5B05|nr:hypothetical protein [Burkholderia plantarii]MBI0331224.1 hypothetical protein [Burkholderia plantarii]